MIDADSKLIRVGFVSLFGRPNTGKSTLLNAILKQKLSIVTRKPQTTRHQITGIKSNPGSQIIFIDTPGLQQKPKQALNRFMNRQVTQAFADIDLVLFMVEALKWTDADEHALKLLQQYAVANVFLVINKTDKVSNKDELLPFIKNISGQYAFREIVPLSARKGDGVAELEAMIINYLPEGQALYPEDMMTDRNERFFAAEFLREKLMSRLGEELPYRLAITIDAFKTEKDICHIHAVIWVEKPGQKQIVIGKEGKVLKAAGKEARLDLEKLLGQKVNLKTWVKVKNKWTESDQALKSLGYDV